MTETKALAARQRQAPEQPVPRSALQFLAELHEDLRWAMPPHIAEKADAFVAAVKELD